jgi:hypothetical protein
MKNLRPATRELHHRYHGTSRVEEQKFARTELLSLPDGLVIFQGFPKHHQEQVLTSRRIVGMKTETIVNETKLTEDLVSYVLALESSRKSGSFSPIQG